MCKHEYTHGKKFQNMYALGTACVYEQSDSERDEDGRKGAAHDMRASFSIDLNEA